MTAKVCLLCGSLLAFFSVALGAFGAHGLKGRLSEALLATFQTGVLYHLVHALALLAVGILQRHYPQEPAFSWAAWLLLAGTLAFSGSLYLLALSGWRGWGLLTPLGGIAFLLGWLALTLALWRTN